MLVIIFRVLSFTTERSKYSALNKFLITPLILSKFHPWFIRFFTILDIPLDIIHFNFNTDFVVMPPKFCHKLIIVSICYPASIALKLHASLRLNLAYRSSQFLLRAIFHFQTSKSGSLLLCETSSSPYLLTAHLISNAARYITPFSLPFTWFVTLSLIFVLISPHSGIIISFCVISTILDRRKF